jgi:hypothetical protein
MFDTTVLPDFQLAELLIIHGIPARDRKPLAAMIRGREPSPDMIRRARASGGRYRRCFDAAIAEIEFNLEHGIRFANGHTLQLVA